MKTILMTAAMVLVLGGPVRAEQAFWSFDTWKSGDGTFTKVVTAHDFAQAPVLEASGSRMLSSGGAAKFTAFNGAIWLGSGRNAPGGHCLAWTSGSTGNVFSITLAKTGGMKTLRVRMDIRAYGFAPGASFTALSADTGEGMKPLPVALKPFPRQGVFGEWDVDLSGPSQLRGKKSVVLKWSVPDAPADGSLKVDNIQIFME